MTLEIQHGLRQLGHKMRNVVIWTRRTAGTQCLWGLTQSSFMSSSMQAAPAKADLPRRKHLQQVTRLNNVLPKAENGKGIPSTLGQQPGRHGCQSPPPQPQQQLPQAIAFRCGSTSAPLQRAAEEVKPTLQHLQGPLHIRHQ